MTRKFIAWLLSQGRTALPPVQLVPKPARVALALFGVTSALIAFCVWFKPSDLARLDAQLSLSLGLAAMLIGAAVHFFPILEYRHKLDIFLTGTLLVWLEYWQRAYALDKPVYQYYPLLFTLACIWVPRFAADPALSELRVVYRYARRFSELLLVVTAISVFLPRYYVFYPAAVLMLLVYVAIVTRLKTQPIVLLCSEENRFLKALGRHLERNYGPTQVLVLSGKQEQPLFSRSRTVPMSENNGSEGLRYVLGHCLVVLFYLDDERDPIHPVLDRALSVLSRRRIAVLQGSQEVNLPALPPDVVRVKANAEQMFGVRAQLDAWLRPHVQLLTPDGGS
ncbi:MAG: hypothetical protein ACREV4_08035 [Gammaproteobacteria bacterium]